MTVGGDANAATPTYYPDLVSFQSDITNTVTDDYSDPGYVFNQNNAAMSAVLGETDYMSTGHMNLNLVVNAPADPRYCSGCNGSFELSFQTTSVGNAVGVNGVGLFIESHNMGMPYYAFITFGDGTTADIALPAAGNFWGVGAPERIERIHFGFSMGGTTTDGYFEMDDLIVGDGNVAGCMVDGDCFDDGDVCTDPVCIGGMCAFEPNVAPCDDGNICTEMDVCDMGVCGGSPVDCDDGNECTNEFCDPGAGCIQQLNSDPCDDGDLCTEMDTCSMGMCVGMSLDCSDGDVCSADICDPMAGCLNEPIEDCCAVDEDCGEEEMCDLAVNECVPIPPSGTSSGGETGDDTGMGETGADSTGAGDVGDSGTGGGSGAQDTGVDPSVGSLGSSGGMGSSGTGDPGEIPPPDFSACDCRSDAGPRGHLWWLMVAFGVFTRRRRRG